MSLRITFDLEEKDLAYFRTAMKRAQESAKSAAPEDVIGRAEAMIEVVQGGNVPNFVSQRIGRVTSLVDMLRDSEWKLPAQERRNVLSALSYFANPEDIIHDSVPVLGYLDDAIMIELIVRELKPEIDAFEDFRRYQREEASRNRASNVTRDQWLAQKRRELHGRMRRRRQARVSKGPTRTRIRLF